MTNSLKVAVCATVVLGSVFSGFASEHTVPFSQQAQELAGKAGDGLKHIGSITLARGADAAGWAQEHASNAFNSVKGSHAYSVAAEKTSDVYASASQKASEAYNLASQKAVLALEWAQGKTPEGVQAWIEAHPYAAITAVVAPLALFIGYKLGKRKPAKQD